MNIVREDIDSLNALVKIKLGPEDYEAKVEERLKDLRKECQSSRFQTGPCSSGHDQENGRYRHIG